MARFYGHFAAAYGTLFLAVFGVALLTSSHIDLGAFGFYGFPVIALVYAAFRMSQEPDFRKDHERLLWENGELRGRLDWLERHHPPD